MRLSIIARIIKNEYNINRGLDNFCYHAKTESSNCFIMHYHKFRYFFRNKIAPMIFKHLTNVLVKNMSANEIIPTHIKTIVYRYVETIVCQLELAAFL